MNRSKLLQRKSKDVQTAGEAQRLRGNLLREETDGRKEKVMLS